MNSLQLHAIIIKVKIKCINIYNALCLFINTGSQIGSAKWSCATIEFFNTSRQKPTVFMIAMQ